MQKIENCTLLLSGSGDTLTVNVTEQTDDGIETAAIYTAIPEHRRGDIQEFFERHSE
jgi:hypothetical protein